MQEGLAYRPALFLERRSEDDSSADKPKKHRDPISWIASMEGKDGNGRAGSSEDAEKSPSDQELAGEKDLRRATDQGPRGDKEAVAGATSSRRQVVAKERTNAAMKSDRYRHRQVDAVDWREIAFLISLRSAEYGNCSDEPLCNAPSLLFGLTSGPGKGGWSWTWQFLLLHLMHLEPQLLYKCCMVSTLL
jgi:hypothetical protein